MRDALRRATGAALTAGALELVLARLSSGPQVRGDVLVTLMGWMALGVAPVWLAGRLLREGVARRVTLALASSLPLLLVSTGILVTPGLADDGWVARATLVWTVAVLGVRFGAARVGPSTAGSPEAAAWIVLAALIAWGVEHGRLPSLFVTAGFGVVALLVGTVALRWLHLPAVFLGAAVVSFAPSLPPEVVWPDSAPGAPGPDVVLFSLAGLERDAAEGRAFEWLRENGVEYRRVRIDGVAGLLAGRRTPPGEGPGSPTLAERLAARGYDTAAIVSSRGLRAAQGYARGYATWHHVAERHVFALPRGAGRREARPLLPRLLTRLGWLDRPAPNGTRRMARWVKELLDQRRIDRPFHVWLHWSDLVPPWLDAEQTDIPYGLAVAIEQGGLPPPGAATAEALRTVYRHEVSLVERGLRYAIEGLRRVPERGRILIVAGTPPGVAPTSVPLFVVGGDDGEPGTVVELEVDGAALVGSLLTAAGLPDSGRAGTEPAGLQ